MAWRRWPAALFCHACVARQRRGGEADRPGRKAGRLKRWHGLAQAAGWWLAGGRAGRAGGEGQQQRDSPGGLARAGGRQRLAA